MYVQCSHASILSTDAALARDAAEHLNTQTERRKIERPLRVALLLLRAGRRDRLGDHHTHRHGRLALTSKGRRTICCGEYRVAGGVGLLHSQETTYRGGVLRVDEARADDESAAGHVCASESLPEQKRREKCR